MFINYSHNSGAVLRTVINKNGPSTISQTDGILTVGDLQTSNSNIYVGILGQINAELIGPNSDHNPKHKRIKTTYFHFLENIFGLQNNLDSLNPSYVAAQQNLIPIILILFSPSDSPGNQQDPIPISHPFNYSTKSLIEPSLCYNTDEENLNFLKEELLQTEPIIEEEEMGEPMEVEPIEKE